MYNHKNNSVDLHSLEHSKIHGVNIKSYDKSGNVTDSTHIPGIKLHDEVYSTKTRKFMNVEDYHATKKKKYLNSLR